MTPTPEPHHSARLTLQLAGLVGALGVGIGAFGAHGLKAMLEAGGRAATFETAVRYHMFHALALLALAALQQRRGGRALDRARWCFVLGTLVFSGSLYILCLTGITWLGAITPIGGLLLIAGWLLLGFGAAEQV